MKVILSGKHLNLTDGLKDSVETKLSRLDKYFYKEMEAKATLSTEKTKQKIEVTIPVNGQMLRAEGSDLDLYNAIDMVVDKLGSQLRKHKTRLMRKGNDTIRFENVEGYIPLEDEVRSEEKKIVKRKQFGYKPMSEEEALLQMELLGHSFFVFTNSETDETSIVYKRKDGNYGILEPE